MAGELAPQAWGIPVVPDGATRDALWPLATRPQNARVYRVDTGTVERWSGSAWADVLQPALPANGRTVATLSAYLANNAVFHLADYLPVPYVPGTTDAGPAMQTMLSAAYAAGGGTCVVHRVTPGHLVTTPLTAYQGVHLITMGGGGKQDHAGGGGGGLGGVRFLFAPTSPGIFLTCKRDPAGINPSGYGNNILENFGVVNTGGANGTDGIYLVNGSTIMRGVWAQSFTGKGLRIVGAISTVVDACMFYFNGGQGVSFDATGNQSTTVSFRSVYSASNSVANWEIQNCIAVTVDQACVSESPPADGVVIDNCTRVSIRDFYTENIPGYGFKIGSKNSGLTSQLTIDDVFTGSGTQNDPTVDFISLANCDQVSIRVVNLAMEKASVLRMAATAGNVKWRLGTNLQRATPGVARANSTNYPTKGTIFTAVCDDAATRTFIVTVPGITAGAKPAGYADDTLSLLDGTARVSRYTTSTDTPVIDKALPLSGRFGDEIARRIVANGTAHLAGNYAVSGWGGAGLAAAQSSRDMGGRFSITAGAAPGANPTVILTFADGQWENPPAISYGRGDLAAPTTGYWALTAISKTAATWTFVGTPVAANVYVLDYTVVGK